MNAKTVTVLVITLNRPDCVRRCLDCLDAQTRQPEQTIVVDASPDTRTRDLVAEYPGVVYLRNDNGFGRMTASRNIGVKSAIGDIIAFLDDDAFAEPDWLEHLAATYTDPNIGAVGGRARNNQPGEESEGLDSIGRLKPNGMLTGNFAADPGRIVEVDHVMGCNMSFPREVIARLGGFREDYPGISGVREDTDMCLRVKRLGYKLLFNPAASVDHISAPQAVGQRFDARYCFYGQRNHVCMLVRHFGFGPMVWRYFAAQGAECSKEFARKIGGAVLRFGANAAGPFVGLSSGLKYGRAGRDPIRNDSDAQAIRAALQSDAPARTPAFARDLYNKESSNKEAEYAQTSP